MEREIESREREGEKQRVHRKREKPAPLGEFAEFTHQLGDAKVREGHILLDSTSLQSNWPLVLLVTKNDLGETYFAKLKGFGVVSHKNFHPLRVKEAGIKTALPLLG